MKTTKKIALYAAMSAAIFTFAQCSSGNEANNGENAATTEEVAAPVAPETINGIKIAYVEYEALMTKYEFAIDINKEMMRKETNISNTIEEKAKSLQAEQAEFTRKYQNNVFATQDRAQSEYERLAKKEQEIMQLQQSLLAEYEKEQIEKHTALRDSVNNFIKEYNAVKGYDFILTKVGDEILYANEAYNITQEVVDGLNGRYKK
ncbi:MAG: OmpH family outer membrane protein [Bacteroidaceae bacterium]|nr:OmpH family outer membrane protein [Bacteroidaceae bacterium]